MEKWNENKFTGTIRVYEEQKPKAQKEYENLDDYDARHKIGGKYCIVKSRLEREEM